MMTRHTILRVVAKFMIPYILLFALYVQFHGDFGPGGGFEGTLYNHWGTNGIKFRAARKSKRGRGAGAGNPEPMQNLGNKQNYTSAL